MAEAPFLAPAIGSTVRAMFTKLRGRKGRLAGIVAAIPLALGLVAAAQPAAAYGGPLRYVALGDSYTAGQGAGFYDDSGCNRSPLGYPGILVVKQRAELVANPSCQGVTAEEVRTTQLPPVPDPTVDLVTLTVGGNDLGFNTLLPACSAGPTAPTCLAVLEVTPQEAADLFVALLATYSAVQATYPNARVVVLSYPRLFGGVLQNQQYAAALNRGTDVLNQVVLAATQAAGVTFVDVRDEFAGHEIGTRYPWINVSLDPVAALHPTAIGYAFGYYKALVNDGIVPAR